MHVIIAPDCPNYQELLDRCNLVLARDFGIFHSTIQLECRCGLEGQLKCSLAAGTKCSKHDHEHHKHA